MKFAALVLAFVAFPAAAQMYKCVDARGVVHYADKPIPGCKGGKLDIPGGPPAAAPAPAPAQPAAQPSAAAAPPKPPASQAYTPDECAGLRKEHEWLAAGGRFGRLNEKGERVYDDQARDERIAKLEEAMRACP